jgi:hypothetical protein
VEASKLLDLLKDDNFMTYDSLEVVFEGYAVSLSSYKLDKIMYKLC